MVCVCAGARVCVCVVCRYLSEVTHNQLCVCMCVCARARRYLSEVIFKKPVICYNYPKEIKAFYMRLNEDGKTVGLIYNYIYNYNI